MSSTALVALIVVAALIGWAVLCTKQVLTTFVEGRRDLERERLAAEASDRRAAREEHLDLLDRFTAAADLNFSSRFVQGRLYDRQEELAAAARQQSADDGDDGELTVLNSPEEDDAYFNGDDFEEPFDALAHAE